MKTATFHTINHFPSRFNSEHVHIGIIVFQGDDQIRVHLLDDLRKLQAIDPNVNLEATRSWVSTLPTMLFKIPPDSRVGFMKNFGNWSISEQPGSFIYKEESEYQHRVSLALGLLGAK